MVKPSTDTVFTFKYMFDTREKSCFGIKTNDEKFKSKIKKMLFTKLKFSLNQKRNINTESLYIISLDEIPQDKLYIRKFKLKCKLKEIKYINKRVLNNG